jgi:hypothetical protein
VIELAEKAKTDTEIKAATEAFIASWLLTKSDTSKIDLKIQGELKDKVINSKNVDGTLDLWLSTQKEAIEKLEIEDFSDIQNMIRSAINILNEDVRQYETNLSFFNTSKNNPLLDQATASLENTKKIIEAHKAVLKHIREVKK